MEWMSKLSKTKKLLLQMSGYSVFIVQFHRTMFLMGDSIAITSTELWNSVVLTSIAFMSSPHLLIIASITPKSTSEENTSTGKIIRQRFGSIVLMMGNRSVNDDDEASALQTEELFDTLLRLSLTGQELQVIEMLYHQAIKLETYCFTIKSLKHIVQQTVIPLSEVLGSLGQRLMCTIVDSPAILAEIAIRTPIFIRPVFSSGGLSVLNIRSNEFAYEESISTGEILRKVESPMGKLHAFKPLFVHNKDSVGYLIWRKQPDLAEAVAAILALASVIRSSKAITLMELEIELKKASDSLKHFTVFGYARSKMTDAELRDMVSRTLTCRIDKSAEIRLQFRHVPGNLHRRTFGTDVTDLDQATNELVIRVQPDEAVYLKINDKVPGLGMSWIAVISTFTTQQDTRQSVFPSSGFPSSGVQVTHSNDFAYEETKRVIGSAQAFRKVGISLFYCFWFGEETKRVF